MILLDTHVVLWLTENDARLSAPARSAVAKARAEASVAICDITLREIAMQIVRKRVAVRLGVTSYLSFVESLFRIIPINGRIAEQSTRFSRAYPRDPADRLIGATAVVHNVDLITADEQIRASGEVECVW